MCKFLSAIGLKNGDIICDPSIDSHEDLISFNELKESKLRNWVRIEYYPNEDKDYADLSKYVLHVDDTAFDWIDSTKESWERKLRIRLKRIIVNEDKKYLPCGIYILGDCKIGQLTYGRIIYAGHSTIENAGHSTIKNAGCSTIENAGHSTIENAGHSTIENAGCSTIEDAGHSTIKDAGHSTIEDAWHSTIEDAGHSTIEDAWYSTIKDAGHSTIKDAGHSTIEDAGCSTIKNKRNAKISNGSA